MMNVMSIGAILMGKAQFAGSSRCLGPALPILLAEPPRPRRPPLRRRQFVGPTTTGLGRMVTSSTPEPPGRRRAYRLATATSAYPWPTTRSVWLPSGHAMPWCPFRSLNPPPHSAWRR